MTPAPVESETVGCVQLRARRRLAAAGIATAALDVRVLLAHVLGCDAAALVGHPERPLDAAQAGQFAVLIRRREQREPVALLVGEREFWSLPMRVSRETLVPRPESETLIAAALERCVPQRGALRVLDLGTGSGCLLMALLSELPDAFGIGIGLSPGALTVARDKHVLHRPRL